MATLRITYHKTAERPDIRLWLSDDDGSLINFASGWTFVFKIGYLGETALVTKSSGITGAAGSGVPPPGVGTPNLTIGVTAGELDTIAASLYTGQVKATNSGLDRFYQFELQIRDVVL